MDEEHKRQLERDEALAQKLRREEMQLKQETEQAKEERQIMEEFHTVQRQLTEDLSQQLDSKYSQEMEELYRKEQMQTNEEI